MPRLYDAFISYARKDSRAFAIQLRDKLAEQNFEIWLDLHQIKIGEDFQKRIDGAIEKSHHLIFIITPGSVTSKFCRKEIELAIELNKRIFPIMYIPPKTCWDQMHPTINKLNQLFSRQDKITKGEINFEAKFAKLVNDLNHQKEYLEQHTRILVVVGWSELANSNTIFLASYW